MATPVNETEIIERLNAAHSVREFFIKAVEVFEIAISTLTQRIFRSDYQAVKSVVNSLLESSGPLGDFSIRLKLLYGLGAVSEQTYYDIELFLTIRNFLNNDGHNYEFTDEIILKKIKQIPAMKNVASMTFDFSQSSDDDINPELYHLHRDRIETVIRSGLSLEIVEICNELNGDV